MMAQGCCVVGVLAKPMLGNNVSLLYARKLLYIIVLKIISGVLMQYAD